MTYKVVKYFKDAQDNLYAYKAGDIFPRSGVSVSDERIEELSTDKNRRGFPLIEAIEEKVPEKVTKTAEKAPEKATKEAKPKTTTTTKKSTTTRKKK